MKSLLKKYFLLPVFGSSIVFSSYGQSATAITAIKAMAASSITPADLSSYLHIIASDSMEGRATGEAGQKKAALYLASKFKEFGLLPAVPVADGKSYFQKFQLVEKTWTDVYLNVNGVKKEFLKDFYAYGDVQLPEEVKLSVVCAGYGIEHAKYNDYKNLNVSGKGVIIFNGEPYKDDLSVLTGTKTPSNWANDWRAKADLAYKKGAKAVFIMVGTKEEDFTKRLDALKDHLTAPSMGFTHKRKASAFFIPLSLVATLLKSTPENVTAYKKTLGTTPVKYPFHSAKVLAKAGTTDKMVNTENVLAMIEGSTYPEEIVVLTAHYDHLGIENGKICYGADDDGSGTASLLEIAQAFMLAKQAGYGPMRTILIMPVTGEERGLMGSEYYTDKPVFPLGKTVVDLNIDMIGRVDAAHPKQEDENYVYIIGDNRLSSELHSISESTNTGNTGPGIVLDYTYNSFDDPNRFYYRSDHYNFAKNNIPVIFYFTGIHEDYHKPTDTVDKIRFDKMAKIVQLVFLTAWEIANLDHTLVVDVNE